MLPSREMKATVSYLGVAHISQFANLNNYLVHNKSRVGCDRQIRPVTGLFWRIGAGRHAARHSHRVGSIRHFVMCREVSRGIPGRPSGELW
jgi:hypothetical protein